MALLLAVSAWTSGGTCRDTAHTAEILSAAGWRVVVATADTPLAAAWQHLHQPFDPVRPPAADRRSRGELRDAKSPLTINAGGGLHAGLHCGASAVPHSLWFAAAAGAVITAP